MTKYSLNEFVDKTTENKDNEEELFELEDDYTLNVNLNGKIWAKKGSMIAFYGNIDFEKQSSLEGGLGKFLKKAVTGEGMELMSAKGKGNLYLADQGKRIALIFLDNETLYVNGNDVLALTESVNWDIKLLNAGGVLTGNLFSVKLEGTGLIAITTHKTPLTLKVAPGQPVYTDPNATVAWSGNLTPEIATNFSLKSVTGRTSGEEIQLKFEGNGFVVIQPYEEIEYIE